MSDRPWQSMDTAPKNATDVEVKLTDGRVLVAHWAEDLSGEEQPPFRGWFIHTKHYCTAIPDPVAWRLLRK